MPTSLLSADTMFPNFKGNETTEEKVNQIQNYLYMLVEQLRYSMANVGKENFNEAEFGDIVNLITEPVYIQLKNETGDINASIQLTEENLSARISDISDLLGETRQTTTELTLSLDDITAGVKDLSGRYSKLQQTVNGFNATVGEINGQYSSVTQNVASITAKVDGHDGRFSVIEESIGNIKLEVNGASIKLTGGGGGEGTVTITGAVTFEELKDATDSVWDDTVAMYNGFVNGLQIPGATVIDGGNIVTGTIKGVTYYSEGGSADGSFVVTANNYARIIGGITYTQEIDYATDPYGMFGDKMWLYTEARNGRYPSIKIDSVGRVSIEARNLNNVTNGGGIYINGAGYVTIESAGTISIRQNGTYWDFEGGVLKRNGVTVLQ